MTVEKARRVFEEERARYERKVDELKIFEIAEHAESIVRSLPVIFLKANNEWTDEDEAFIKCCKAAYNCPIRPKDVAEFCKTIGVKWSGYIREFENEKPLTTFDEFCNRPFVRAGSVKDLQGEVYLLCNVKGNNGKPCYVDVNNMKSLQFQNDNWLLFRLYGVAFAGGKKHSTFEGDYTREWRNFIVDKYPQLLVQEPFKREVWRKDVEKNKLGLIDAVVGKAKYILQEEEKETEI